MSYSNPMHHEPGTVRPWTLPDGTKSPYAPPSWPFGTIRPAPPTAPPQAWPQRPPKGPPPDAEPAPF